MYEIYLPIKEYENLYEVSNLGNIRNKDKKIIKPFKSKKGYLRVSLYKENKKKNFSVHKLVIETFKPNSENKPHIDHINRIKTDNRLNNLRYVTEIENSTNTSQNKKVICIETGMIFNSTNEVLRYFNKTNNHSTLYNCLKDITGTKTFMNFHFKYL